ncbi:efflux RND transporter periplasmic adaptor subunit [Sessilibacter sp. MAH2]
MSPITVLRSLSIALLTASAAVAAPLPAMDCLINPFQTIDLSSPVAGVIAKLHVEHGVYVNENEIVAQLSAEVEKASVELASVRAAVTSEVGINAVNKEYDEKRKKRIDTLYKSNSVSYDVKDQADRDFDLSQWRLKQAEDLQNIRHLELVRAEEQLQQKIIKSPISGFVTKRFKDVGEYVEEQPIVRIAQLHPLKIEVIVPISYYSQISIAQTAQIFPELHSDKPLTATVISIDPMADAASGTFGARLVLDNPQYTILAGQKCSLQFSENQRSKLPKVK